jgi:hypothetical protein
MATQAPVATLIGDIVGSRRVRDRYRLQRALDRTLSSVSEAMEPVQPLEPTVGDEFQGVFREISEAVQASLMIRLELFKAAEVDSRYGLGYGNIAVLAKRSPTSQDGPGWWAARDALLEAELTSEGRAAFVRTVFKCGEENAISPAEASAWSAFLVCRDALVEQMNPRGVRLLLGVLWGKPQFALADEERISPSAVSQNLSRSSALALVASMGELGWRER